MASAQIDQKHKEPHRFTRSACRVVQKLLYRFFVEIARLFLAFLCDFLVTRPVVIIIEDIIEERQKRFSEKHAIPSYTNTK